MPNRNRTRARKRYPVIRASQVRPLSTELFIRTGEHYTHPWQMRNCKTEKNRYSLYKGSVKKFEVIFEDEIPTELKQKNQTARFVSRTRRRS